MKGTGALYTLSYFTTIEIIFSAFQNDYTYTSVCVEEYLASIPGRLKYGLVLDDSAHALVYSPESGGSPLVFLPSSIFYLCNISLALYYGAPFVPKVKNVHPL